MMIAVIREWREEIKDVLAGDVTVEPHPYALVVSELSRSFTGLGRSLRITKKELVKSEVRVTHIPWLEPGQEMEAIGGLRRRQDRQVQ